MTAITTIPTERTIHPPPATYELPVSDLQDLLLAPPINRDQLLEQCLNNVDFALLLLDEFAKTTQSRLEEVDTALAEGNYTGIASKAHALKGVAGILAARHLVEICATLESTASGAVRSQTAGLLKQLHHECQRLIAFIPTVQAMR